MFLGSFDDVEDIERAFDCKGALARAKVLLAVYDCDCYEGSAFVLFRRGKKLYEVNGGHCSCYGLEGQWEPEETTVAALTHRLEEGYLGYYDESEGSFRSELRTILHQLGAG